MMEKELSKYLSLILRHSPEKIGLNLDDNGWADVDELIQKCNNHSQGIDISMLQKVVENNDKRRFSFNNDLTKIRANQGHSIEIELNLIPITPPEILFHGTVSKFMENIRENGLLKMSRHHVHLSKDEETAIKVGSRRGKPIIIKVNAISMHEDGFKFYCSVNGVWLTDSVQPKYMVL